MPEVWLILTLQASECASGNRLKVRIASYSLFQINSYLHALAHVVFKSHDEEQLLNLLHNGYATDT